MAQKLKSPMKRTIDIFSQDLDIIDEAHEFELRANEQTGRHGSQRQSARRVISFQDAQAPSTFFSGLSSIAGTPQVERALDSEEARWTQVTSTGCLASIVAASEAINEAIDRSVAIGEQLEKELRSEAIKEGISCLWTAICADRYFSDKRIKEHERLQIDEDSEEEPLPAPMDNLMSKLRLENLRPRPRRIMISPARSNRHHFRLSPMRKTHTDFDFQSNHSSQQSIVYQRAQEAGRRSLIRNNITHKKLSQMMSLPDVNQLIVPPGSGRRMRRRNSFASRQSLSVYEQDSLSTRSAHRNKKVHKRKPPERLPEPEPLVKWYKERAEWRKKDVTPKDLNFGPSPDMLHRSNSLMAIKRGLTKSTSELFEIDLQSLDIYQSTMGKEFSAIDLSPTTGRPRKQPTLEDVVFDSNVNPFEKIPKEKLDKEINAIEKRIKSQQVTYDTDGPALVEEVKTGKYAVARPKDKALNRLVVAEQRASTTTATVSISIDKVDSMSGTKSTFHRQLGASSTFVSRGSRQNQNSRVLSNLARGGTVLSAGSQGQQLDKQRYKLLRIEKEMKSTMGTGGKLFPNSTARGIKSEVKLKLEQPMVPKLKAQTIKYPLRPYEKSSKFDRYRLLVRQKPKFVIDKESYKIKPYEGPKNVDTEKVVIERVPNSASRRQMDPALKKGLDDFYEQIKKPEEQTQRFLRHRAMTLRKKRIVEADVHDELPVLKYNVSGEPKTVRRSLKPLPSEEQFRQKTMNAYDKPGVDETNRKPKPALPAAIKGGDDLSSKPQLRFAVEHNTDFTKEYLSTIQQRNEDSESVTPYNPNEIPESKSTRNVIKLPKLSDLGTGNLLMPSVSLREVYKSGQVSSRAQLLSPTVGGSTARSERRVQESLLSNPLKSPTAEPAARQYSSQMTITSSKVTTNLGTTPQLTASQASTTDLLKPTRQVKAKKLTNFTSKIQVKNQELHSRFLTKQEPKNSTGQSARSRNLQISVQNMETEENGPPSKQHGLMPIRRGMTMMPRKKLSEEDKIVQLMLRDDL